MTFGGRLVRNARLADSKRDSKPRLRRVAGEQDDWWYRAKCLLLVGGGPCGEITFVMSQCHADLRGLGGKCVCDAPCHWGARSMLVQTRRVAGERQERPTRVSQKSVAEECPVRVAHKSVLQECPTRVSHKSVL